MQTFGAPAPMSPMSGPGGPQFSNMAQPQAPRSSSIQTFNSNTGTGANRPQPTSPRTQQEPTQPKSKRGTPVKEIRDSIKDIKEALSEKFELEIDTTLALKGLTDMLRAANDGSKDMKKAFKGVRDTLADITEEVEDTGDQIKAVSKLTKQIKRDGLFETQTVEEANEFVKSLVAQLKEVKKNAVKDPIKFKGSIKEIEEAEAALAAITAELETMKGTTGQVTAEMTAKFNKATAGIGKSMKSLSTEQAKLAKQAKEGWGDFFKEIGGHHQKLFESISKSKDALKGLGKLTGLNAKGLTTGGAALKERAQKTLQAKAEQKAALESKWSQDPRGVGFQMFGSTKGFNPIRNMLFSRAMKANSMGEMGAMGRMAMEGGGSLTKGLLGRAGGALAGAGGRIGGAMGAIGGLAGGGGMGAAMGLAGRAVPFIAVAKGLMDLADKTAEMNKAVEAATAGGGLFGGKGTNGTVNAFAGIRNFASSGGFDLNFLGQDFQKNLNVMKAMIEEGIGVDSDIRSGQGVNKWGNGPGSLQDRLANFKTGKDETATAAIYQNAIFGSRTLGMSQEESVKLTTKLMMKYQQSAKDTVVFFDQVSTQSAAAGISASKYIDVISSLADQMGDLNSSFVSVVLTVEKLGKSGRFTAEQLKSMGETMLGSSKKVGPEYLAYMFKSTGMGGVRKGAQADENIAAMQFNQGIANNQAAQKVFGPNFDIKSHRNNIGALESKLDQAGREGLIQQADVKNIQGMISAYKQSVSTSSSLGGNEVGSALAFNAVGGGANASSAATLQLLKQMSKDAKIKGGVSALMENTGAALRSGNGIGAMYLEQYLKMNPNAIEDVSRFTGGMANATVSTMGLDTEEGVNVRKKVLGSMSAENRKKFKITGKTEKDQLDQLKAAATGSLDTRSGLADTLKGNTDLLTDIMNGSEAAASYLSAQNAQQAKWQEEEKTRAAEAQTKTTADIFARSFEYLFNKIFNPLASLRDFLVKDKDANEAEKVSKTLDWMSGDNMRNIYLPKAQERLATLQKELADSQTKIKAEYSQKMKDVDKGKGTDEEKKKKKADIQKELEGALKEAKKKSGVERQEELIAGMKAQDNNNIKTWAQRAAASNRIKEATGMEGASYIDENGNVITAGRALTSEMDATHYERVKKAVADSSSWYGTGSIKEKTSKDMSAEELTATVAGVLYGNKAVGGMWGDASKGELYQSVDQSKLSQVEKTIAGMGKDSGVSLSADKKTIIYNVNQFSADFRASVLGSGVPLSDSAEATLRK